MSKIEKAENLVEEFKKEAAFLLEKFREEIKFVRGDRASPGLIENLSVEYYDSFVPLKQLASITTRSPSEIEIQVWDKEVLPKIRKVLEEKGYPCNLSGQFIYLKLPSLSAERKEELIKEIKKIAENFRIENRMLRDKSNEKIKEFLREKEISEDEKFRLKQEIQKQVDSINEKIGEILENKIRQF